MSLEFATRRILVSLVLAALLTGLGFALVFWAKSMYDVPWGTFTRDPMTVVRSGHPIIGILSNAGVILWIAAASGLLTAAAMLRGRIPAEALRALWLPGLLSLLLGIDDLYMVHELLSQERYGIDERWLFGAYGVLLAAYALSCRRVLLSSGIAPVLPIAIAGFAGSLYVDTLPKNWSPYHHLWEDGLKFAGLATWTVFQLAMAVHLGRREGEVEGAPRSP